MKNTFSKNSGGSVETWRQNVRTSSDTFASVNPEQEPPSYSQIPDFDFSGAACCAFQRLRENTQDSIFMDMLQKSPQYMLLCWVALVRNNDPGLSPDDRHRCPFPWCDAVFAETEHMELITHVATCPRISHGTYVCPYHRTTETFAKEMEPGHRSRRQFFRHAFDAICKIGSKGIRKAIHPSKVGSRVEFKTGKKRMRSEVDLKTPLAPSELPPELPSNGLEIPDLPEVSFVTSQPSKRMSHSSTLELPSTRSRYFEMDGLIPVPDTPVAELASHRMSRLTTSENAAGSGSNSDFSNSPVSPISSGHWLDSEGFASAISPDVTGFASRPWSSADVQHQAMQTPAHNGFVAPHQLDARTNMEPTQGDASSWPVMGSSIKPYPKIRIDTTCTMPPPSRFNALPQQPTISSNELSVIPSPLQIESDTRSPVKLVEELRGLFHQLFKLSCTKISQPPVSPAGAALFRGHPTSASTFEKGCKALGKVVRGVLPTTFREIFGLAHLAYAAALADQEPEIVELLPEIYDDLVRWSEAVVASNDKAGYLDLIQQLFTPEGHAIARLTLDSTTPQSSSNSRRAYRHAASFNLNDLNNLWLTSGAVGQPAQAPHKQNNERPEQSLFSSLRQGIVVQLCLRYLGALEYLMQDANTNTVYPSFLDLEGQSPTISNKTARNTYILRKHVIDQLLVVRGIEGFRPVIEDAALMLSASPQTTLRDLELYLLQEGKGHAKSQSVYRKYLARVEQLCNTVSVAVGWELPSRDHHLVRDVEQLLKIHGELLSNSNFASLNQNDPVLAQAPQPAPMDPWDVTVSDNTSGATGNEHFPFSWTTTPTSASNSPAHNDPSFFWADQTTPNDPSSTADPTPSHPTEAPSNPTSATKPKHRPEPLSNASLATLPTGGHGGALNIAPLGPSPTSDQTDGTLKCHVCDKVLQGKLVYLPSNMKRHIRELHSPAARRLMCGVDGCARAFIRNHNLLHHQRTVHQMRV